jgi:hypothetical protein
VRPDELLVRRVARAALDVTTELQVAGSVVRRRADWPGSVEDWTTASAAAEDRLQRPVASGLSRATDTVWATLLDWPRSTEELVAAARRNQELTARVRGVPSVPERGSGTVAGWTRT